MVEVESQQRMSAIPSSNPTSWGSDPARTATPIGTIGDAGQSFTVFEKNWACSKCQVYFFNIRNGSKYMGILGGCGVSPVNVCSSLFSVTPTIYVCACSCASVTILMNQGVYARNFIEFMIESQRKVEERLEFDSRMIYEIADVAIASFLLLRIAVGCRLGLSFAVVERNMAIDIRDTN